MGRIWRVAVLPGDGVGPEISGAAVRVLQAAADCGGLGLRLEQGQAGSTACGERGDILPPETVQLCDASDAILTGGFGRPDPGRRTSYCPQPSVAAILRRRYSLFAELRPVRRFPGLAAASPPGPNSLAPAWDVLLVGDVAAGPHNPRSRGSVALIGGGRRAYDTGSYTTGEVEQVARLALALAQGRRRRLASVDRSDLLASGVLWRETVRTLAAAEFGGVAVEHLTLPEAVCRFAQRPGEFDVILSDGGAGPVLAALDAAATGCPSLAAAACVGAESKGLYSPGWEETAADPGAANPLGAILATALLLRHTCGAERAAAAVERAVAAVLAAGCRTAGMPGAGAALGTQAMGDRVAAAVAAAWEG